MAGFAWDDEDGASAPSASSAVSTSSVSPSSTASFQWDDAPTPERPGALGSALAGAGQGLSMGFSDEAYGAAGAAVNSLGNLVGLGNGKSMWDNYSEYRDSARDYNHRASEAHPVLYNGADLAASVAPTLIPGVGPAGLAARAGLAAAGGAVRGVGDAQGMDEIPGNALKGAALGGVMGGAVGPALGYAGGLAASKAGSIANKGMNYAARAPIVGPVIQHAADGIDNAVDNGLNKMFANGWEKTADVLGDGYNALGRGTGVLGRGALAYETDGDSLKWEAGLRGAGAAAKYGAANRIARNPMAAGNTVGNAIDDGNAPPLQMRVQPNNASQGNWDDPETTGSIATGPASHPEEVQRRIAGTPFERMLIDAKARGASSYQAMVYTLSSSNPQFRKLMGWQQ